MSNSIRIKISEKLANLFQPPFGDYRFRIAYGGRGSGKSYTFALMALLNGYLNKMRILCTREFQISIKDSFYAELKLVINEYDFLRDHYTVGESFIRGANGTEFIFKGLRHNIASIKSITRINLCIVEEASDVPYQSWIDLIPTIRAQNSEIWIIFNPRKQTDGVCKLFLKGTLHPDALRVKVNYHDNPWFPEVLEKQRQHDEKTLDPATYNWIWNGQFLKQSNAQIFSNRFRILNFETHKEFDGPYYGLDFGFSQDPTACVEMFIFDNVLYITRECGQINLELDHTAEFLKKYIPGIEKYQIMADSARPESISYLKRKGLPKITAVKKGANSIKDGISFMKSFSEILIHPHCVETIKEFDLYSYKVDRLSNEISDQIIDKYNHYIDAIRYGLEPIMKQSRYNLKSLMRF